MAPTLLMITFIISFPPISFAFDCETSMNESQSTSSANGLVVYARTLSGDLLAIELSTDATIGDLNQMIHQMCNMKFGSLIHLSCGGNELGASDMQLCDAGICAESLIDFKISTTVSFKCQYHGAEKQITCNVGDAGSPQGFIKRIISFLKQEFNVNSAAFSGLDVLVAETDFSDKLQIERIVYIDFAVYFCRLNFPLRFGNRGVYYHKYCLGAKYWYGNDTEALFHLFNDGLEFRSLTPLLIPLRMIHAMNNDMFP